MYPDHPEEDWRRELDAAVAFVDMKWPRAAAKQRKSIAEALANVTSALLKTGRGAPSETEIRRAVRVLLQQDPA